ncbi:phytoene desaturase family protein [Cerasicoccus arenae]|uniref:Phytoene dehydrogenase n=1 Tax=Cerasicoccus arenae TaxID=424488 RepID=A0A8J3GCS1_9BACT|nr:NAD(P)/FAD-dependent oxidoreductase [Cerasicoccus arenae]MBK1858878.1 NAD(P)/FAD-dependent oxidoreductase [Cerasicoccus arenae]GHB96217.1 phytoene dehydrogenase [Cerasicoccus arenae]
MAKDWLEGIEEEYDVVVIGSGLGGLTGANTLAKMGHRVLLLEHHYQLGGLATWFKRPGRHIFDISLHGFPHGMIKSCRKYWGKNISERIVQLKRVRFINPQFDVETTFDREDFTKIFVEKFKVPREQVEGFFEHLRQMNYYDRDERTAKELFEEFFPGRNDVHRLLMEPISYANGSTWDDPAITYGIVFSNFMSKGVFIYQGGTDQLIAQMTEELEKNGVTLRKNCLVEKVHVENGHVTGVTIAPRTGETRTVRCKAVLSNSNIKNTIFELAGKENFTPEFIAEANAVRVNTSSCQVYIGIKRGESIPDIGDLVFTSEAEEFSSEELTSFNTSSRTFSVYYPETRPHLDEDRYAIVASLNAQWADWKALNDQDYEAAKKRLCEEALTGLEKFIPDIREKVDHLEAATPRTVKHYVRHFGGTSFGTKFEGLKVSMELPEQLPGLYHAGSVGIIMSGWLGTINYGVIVASKVDSFLRS